jgi:hypothetical protein
LAYSTIFLSKVFAKYKSFGVTRQKELRAHQEEQDADEHG